MTVVQETARSCVNRGM